jgi:hypothetical protein
MHASAHPRKQRLGAAHLNTLAHARTHKHAHARASTHTHLNTLIARARTHARAHTRLKTFPFDQHVTFGSFSLSFATVVPLPVPESPQSTTTSPCASSPHCAMISSAT